MRESQLPGRPKKRGSGNSLAERKGERGKGTQSKDKIYQKRGASESRKSFHSICVCSDYKKLQEHIPIGTILKHFHHIYEFITFFGISVSVEAVALQPCVE